MANKCYIERDEISDISEVTIKQSKIVLKDYDMYYVKFFLKDGSSKRVRTFCDKGTFPPASTQQYKAIKKNYATQFRKFFIDRLIGNKGLMAQAKRSDYIYLGTDFLKNGYIATRSRVLSNGRTGEEEFERNLTDLKKQVKTKEQQLKEQSQTETNQKQDKSSDKTGQKQSKTSDNAKQKQSKASGKSGQRQSKTSNGENLYVISDIHGQYQLYMRAIQMLKSNDKLYIIGDAIDRGPGGIEILLDAMNRDNVKLLLGNHELMMLRAIKIIKKYNLTDTELAHLCQAGQAINSIIESENDIKHTSDTVKIARSTSVINTCKIRRDTNIKSVPRVKLTDVEMQRLYAWFSPINGGEVTYNAFKKLPRSKQDQLLNYLENAFIYAKKTVDGKPYILAHGAPPHSKEAIALLNKFPDAALTYSDIKSEKAKDILLDSVTHPNLVTHNAACKLWNDAGYVAIYGHTPTIGKIIGNRKKGRICIDAGCGNIENATSALGFYCINTDKAMLIGKDGKLRDNPTDKNYDAR